MFQLRFAPIFARQQKAFLAVTETPELTLTPELSQALTHFERDEAQNLITKKLRPIDLWLACFKGGRSIFFKATLASCLAASCATGSTLIAMRILRLDSSSQVLIGFATAYLLSNTLSLFANFSNNRMRAELALTSETLLVSMVSKKLLNLSSIASSQQSSGNLKVLIASDVKNISEFLNNVVRNLIPSLTAILIMGPFLVHLAGKAGWISLMVLTLIIPITLALNQISIALQDLTQTRMDEHASIVGEWVKNIRLVRFLGWDEYFEIRIKEVIRRFIKIALVQHVIACIVFGLSTTWWMVTGASVLLFAKIFHDPLPLSAFFGSLWLLTFVASYFTHLPNTIRVYGLAVPSLRRILKLLNEPNVSDDFDIGPSPDPQSHPTKVIFSAVSFRTLKNINVEIRLNQKSAILGEVGSGKSTFLDLLCGEYKPSSGQISIEFNDGTKYPLWQKDVHAKLRTLLARVSQTPYISSDRLSTNITFNSSDDDEADLLNSIQKAQLTEDLAQFAEGTSQMIGESGVNLSGGQRQRLNLARAFYSKRPYLVLDDTLSAVDSRTEAALIQQIIEGEAGVLLVTHRLSEIRRLGYVLVFQSGMLIEEGKPEDLSQNKSSAFVRAIRAYDHV